jgi:putative phage-type endonuclease
MIVHDVEQGSEEWLRLRCTIPTASEFGKIITPAKGELSKQADSYRNILLASWVTGRPVDEFLSHWMERGQEMEPEACAWYEFQEDQDAQSVGFITRDDGMVGASPDRMVGDSGLLEVKCPSAHVHLGYLLKNTLPTQYKPQTQGQLLVTEREWVDFLSYHPDLPPVLIRVHRDEAYIEKLRSALDKFVDGLIAAREKLAQRGIGPQQEKAA